MKNEKRKLRTSCDIKTPAANKRVLVTDCFSISFFAFRRRRLKPGRRPQFPF
jgi:hypothetical protein